MLFTNRRHHRTAKSWRKYLRASVLTGLLLVCGTFPGFGQSLDFDDWHAVTSQHFTLLTDAEPKRGVELLEKLETFRSAFALLSPQLELQSVVPTTFIAFRDRHSYAPYKTQPDTRYGSILGQFLPHPDHSFLTFDASAQVGTGFSVIYHEFVHYLIAHNFSRVPRWFHEGLAEYYSTFAIRGDTVYLGYPVTRHVKWLRRDNADRDLRSLTHEVSLLGMLNGDSGHHGRGAGSFYAMSWALMHYLMSGGAERLDQVADFIVRLNLGEEAEEAFEASFDAQLDDLEDTIREYALKPPPYAFGDSVPGEDTLPVATLELSQLGLEPATEVHALAPADLLFQLGNLQLRLGRKVSESYFHAAFDQQPNHPEALAGLAHVRDLEGRFAEAEVLYQDALSSNSRDPLTFVRYGRHLLARIQSTAAAELVAAGRLTVANQMLFGEEAGHSEELAAAERLADTARAAFAKAIDLDPWFAEARALFGFTHQFGTMPAGPGIKALKKVRRWLPERDDLTLVLLQLHLKDAAFNAAERLLATQLEGRAQETVVLWAREEIERAQILHAATAALKNDRPDEALRLFDEAIAITSDQDLRDRMAAHLTRLQASLQDPDRPPAEP